MEPFTLADNAKAPDTGLELTEEAHETSKTLVNRLVREQLWPQHKRILLTFLCMLLVAGTSASMIYLLKDVVDQVLIARDRTMLYLLPGAIIGLAIISGLAGYFEAVNMEVIGHRMVANLQSSMYRGVIRTDLQFFLDNSVGILISRFINDANLLRHSMAKALTGLIKDSLLVIFLLMILVFHNWSLALLTIIVFPLALYPIVKIGKRIRKISRNTQIETGDLTTLLDETFQGARHVKAYTMEKRESDRASDAIERVYQLTRKAARIQAISRPLMESLGGIALACAILFGGLLVIDGQMTTGELASFMAALLAAYKPMKNIANLNATLQQGLAATQRVFAILDLGSKITNSENARTIHDIRGQISFEDVHFQYNEKSTALNGINLQVDAGKTAALVGPSGSGKSTVLNLIPRFYDVGSGKVLIDGQDVRDITLESLRSGIGLVSQEILLFDDTIRANIAYGKPDATDEEIVRAASDAGAAEFISEFPNGYDTQVGGRGAKLSGGQRQRIAIARAMLKDAPILLLDEATSALDTETERLVQGALSRLKQGRTTLVIAHRLSTIIDADFIFFMQNGKVVETGTHIELMAQGGAYAKLYSMQFVDEEDQTAAVVQS
ncbi:MAG: Lipid A export ATP-binding/permease protein MsbA [Alphaproteobacteria bacterium MarineAlpha11_Bin1]|nr:MAG: Lipid A export ATP-binding/permease protein MsbA [Alphaproteobacteria bacterium MarineAlpha11_Bin1]|tara:strand:- start:7426 stop:9264 length:1839 start_codon:yes stop_codon:yes gene_type:complete